MGSRALAVAEGVGRLLPRLKVAHAKHSALFREFSALIWAAAAVIVLGAVGAAAVTRPSGWSTERTAALAILTKGDLSDQGLRQVTAGMDPAMIYEAKRFDAALIRPVAAPFWAGVGGGEESAPPVFKLQDVSASQAMLINAAIPFSILPNPAAKPFILAARSQEDRAEAAQCLTAAIYYEADSESDEGEAAVAQVVLNRMRHPLFPKTICGVVFQGSQLPTGCQFTFTCDGSLNRQPTAEGWARAQRIAEKALAGYVVKEVGEATHYHAVYVVPYWNTALVKLTQIGAHIFYRWNGSMGGPRAFTLAYAGSEGGDWSLASAKLIKVSAPVTLSDAPAQALQIAPEKPAILVAEAAPVTTVELKTTVAPPVATLNTQAPVFETTLAHDPRPRPMIAVPSNW